MTKAMFEKQKRAPSYTELKIYRNRSHWTCIQPRERLGEPHLSCPRGWGGAGCVRLLTRHGVASVGTCVVSRSSEEEGPAAFVAAMIGAEQKARGP